MADTAGMRRAAPPVLMAASGFAALGCQVVWTQRAGVWLGHEGLAVLAVVAAFFGGLAFGAALLARRIARSARPGLWYAACEALVALWSGVLMYAWDPAGQQLAGLLGPDPAPAWQLTLAFAGSFLLLLPATAAMGATLPAMERVAAAWGRRGHALAALYAANTAGAVAGVLAVTFVLVPALGLVRVSLLCAALNAACAAGAWALQRRADLPADTATLRPIARRLAARLALTGFLGIAYEVLALRVLSQVCENTVFTFANLLAVYLVGTALGAAAHARWAPAGGGRGAWADRLLAALVLAVLAGAATLWGAEAHRAVVAQVLGGGLGAELLAEASLALAAFGLPTFLMGALFSELCLQARAEGGAFGAALALNTAAASLAPLVFGALLLPALGAKAALLLVAAGYLLLLPVPAWKRPAPLLPAAAAVALALFAPPLRFVQVPEGGRIASLHEGRDAVVSVVEDAQGVAVLRIDNRQQEGSSASAWADGRQALLPLLLHPRPQRALFLGLGTGVTAGTAAQWDTALQVDAVELLPEVVEASAHFGTPQGRQALHVHTADARRFVRLPGAAYDVVVADNFHPARSGSAALYTVEHFQAVRARLAPDGLFCQWLPLHQMDRATLQSIVRSYQAVFPQAHAMLATLSLQTPTLGLVARRDGAPFAAPQPPPRAAAYGLDERLAVLGSFVAGPAALRRFAEGAPLNTDDRPLVRYLAPRITYAPDSTPAQRLLHLTRELSVTPSGLAVLDAPEAARLAAYLRARDGFIEAGQHVQPSGDVRRMLAQVQQPLLALLRISPEFAPAREPLERMAEALQPLDPQAASTLREEIARVVR